MLALHAATGKLFCTHQRKRGRDEPLHPVMWMKQTTQIYTLRRCGCTPPYDCEIRQLDAQSSSCCMLSSCRVRQLE